MFVVVLMIVVISVMIFGVWLNWCVVVVGIINMVVINSILIILMVIVIMMVREIVSISCFCCGEKLFVKVRFGFNVDSRSVD